jgi:hypothetical protein
MRAAGTRGGAVPWRRGCPCRSPGRRLIGTTGRRDARSVRCLSGRARAQWWRSFEASERAFDAAGHVLSAEDLRPRRRRLAEQHDQIAGLLQGFARERHATSPLVQWLGGPRLTRRVLGLPADVTACVFDLDGVLTTSATLHAAAWADAFHDLLFERAERGRPEFAPFERGRD